MSRQRVTGHVKIVQRKRGPVVYLKWRDAQGHQHEQLLGDLWDKPGRPPAGAYTKRMANDSLSDRLSDLRRGTGDVPRSGATFADAAAEYLRYVSDVRKIDETTVRDYRGVINGYLAKRFGEMALEAITPDDIDAYKEDLIAGGRLSNRVIVRHLTVLHGIFRRAKRVWGLASNPASADVVERPQVVYTGEFQTLTGDEVRVLAASAATTQDGALYTVAAFTGLRQGELLALRWKDVDFLTGLVHVRRNYTDRREKTPKGKKVRSVPMTVDVVDALARLKDRQYFTADDDLVFPNDVGEHLCSWGLRRHFYAALKRANLPRIRFHDLRHCFGSAAITRLDGYAVQSYMGHQHYSTTQRYLHHRPRPQDALALHDAFASETVSPTVSRNGEIGGNSAQRGDTNLAS